MSNIWNNPTVTAGSLFDIINRQVNNYCDENQAKISNLRSSKTLFCFSDYSGEEADADYAMYSFIIISGEQLQEWDSKRKKLRSEVLADGRRVSFKNYRDKLSANYIKEYLRLADELHGFLFTFAFHKNIKSIFASQAPPNNTHGLGVNVENWTTDTKEKTFRILHLISFCIAGLSNELQNIFWITDNDKITPNAERLGDLTKLFGNVLSQYLPHNMGHIRVGTTESDDGTLLIEDLCAIPDLAAGAFSDKLKTFKNQPGIKDFFWMYSPDFKTKTATLIWWLSNANENLTKICFKLDANSTSGVDVKFYHFKNRE